jgi:hypothetical protein
MPSSLGLTEIATTTQRNRTMKNNADHLKAHRFQKSGSHPAVNKLVDHGVKSHSGAHKLSGVSNRNSCLKMSGSANAHRVGSRSK